MLLAKMHLGCTKIIQDGNIQANVNVFWQELNDVSTNESA